jgi:O-antigen ligase
MFTLYNLISILCAMVVPLLIIGPFLPDLIISVLSIIFLIYIYISEKKKIFQNNFFYFFLAFWLFCIISSLLSDNILFSLKSSFFYIRIAIFALLISYLIDQNKKILDYFYFTFFLTFSLLIIDGYLQYFTTKNLLGYNSLGSQNYRFRISSLFGDEYILGSYIVRLLPLYIALFFVRIKKFKHENYIFFFQLILLSVLIFLSGERASFILYIVGSFFMLLMVNKFFFYRLCILLISLILITSIIFKDVAYRNRYLISPFDHIDKSVEKFFFSPIHDSLIKTAWNIFLHNKVFGTGPKTFRIECKNEKYVTAVSSCQTHPHNFYAQLLAETGVVGFSFLAALLIYLVFISIKYLYIRIKKKKLIYTNYQICLFAGLLITVWPITTNGNFFTNNLMILYGLQMGFFKKN